MVGLIGVGGLIKSETDKKRKNYRSQRTDSPAPTSIINAPTLISYTGLLRGMGGGLVYLDRFFV